MRILLVHHRLPYPLHSGMDKVRFNLIKALSERHQITLLYPYDKGSNNEIPVILKSYCHTIIPIESINSYKLIKSKRRLYVSRLIRQVVYRIPTYITNNFQPEIAEKVTELTDEKEFDAVQTLSDITSKYMEFLNNNNILRLYGPMDDTLTSSWTDMMVETKIRKKIGWLMEYRARKSWQPKICQNADVAFFFSDKDKNHLEKVCKRSINALVLPAIIEECDEWDPDSIHNVEKNSFIFVGGLGSLFNKHAVLYFIKNSLPFINKEIPDFKFYIVGQSPDKDILKYRSDKIIVTGEVSDVRPFVEKAAVYISPVFAGSGFKTKIVEALRFGKPIVTTKSGIQGLWELGDDVFSITDDPKIFANEIISLLRNNTLRVEKSLKARKLFEESYSYTKVLPSILHVYDNIEKEL